MGSLTHEQPLPPLNPPLPTKLQYPRRKNRANSVPAKHPKEEDGHALRELAFLIPSREGVDRARYVASLCEAEYEPGDEEACAVLEENLHCGDYAEADYLAGYPLAGTELEGAVSFVCLGGAGGWVDDVNQPAVGACCMVSRAPRCP